MGEGEVGHGGGVGVVESLTERFRLSRRLFGGLGHGRILIG